MSYLYHPDDATYPDRLRLLPDAPALTSSGPLVGSSRVVAIVGSREPLDDAREFAASLAAALASRGVTIVSGGARGIDATAHRAALRAGGATWAVLPTGCPELTPKENEDLFDEIRSSDRSAIVWPFPDGTSASNERYLARNGVLVALADAVVVIQAHVASGSRNAMTWARDLDRALFVPGCTPWARGRFGGTLAALEEGLARPIYSVAHLLRELDLTTDEVSASPRRRAIPRRRPVARLTATPDPSWTSDEKLVFSSLSDQAQHRDALARKSGLGIQAIATALLTLSLKDVVVEGPDGFFRRP